jgi:hypothetical protein
VCGSRELKARLDDEPTIHWSGYGGDDWTQPYADKHVKEGDVIDAGDVRLEFLHTPDDTPEHICIVLKDHPLGITTAFEQTMALIGQAVMPQATVQHGFFPNESPRIGWEWMLVVGVFVGGLDQFISVR